MALRILLMLIGAGVLAYLITLGTRAYFENRNKRKKK